MQVIKPLHSPRSILQEKKIISFPKLDCLPTEQE